MKPSAISRRPFALPAWAAAFSLLSSGCGQTLSAVLPDLGSLAPPSLPCQLPYQEPALALPPLLGDDVIANWGADVKDRNEIAVKFNENLAYSKATCVAAARTQAPPSR